jgi:hypothetical protein
MNASEEMTIHENVGSFGNSEKMWVTSSMPQRRFFRREYVFLVGKKS